jgi:hypothetical protein
MTVLNHYLENIDMHENVEIQSFIQTQLIYNVNIIYG